MNTEAYTRKSGPTFPVYVKNYHSTKVTPESSPQMLSQAASRVRYCDQHEKVAICMVCISLSDTRELKTDPSA